MELNEIGERLLALRKKQGITQEEIAVSLGLKVVTYRSIEKGRTFGRIDTLVMLAEYFDVSLDYLVCGKVSAEHEIVMQLSCLSEEKREKVYQILKAVMEVLK